MPQSYSSQFILDVGSSDEFSIVRDHVLDWVRTQPGNDSPIEARAGEYDLGEVGRAIVAAGEFGSAQTWSLVWSRPDASGREIDWRSEVQLATLGEGVEVTVSVRVVSQKQVVVPVPAGVRRPRIVPHLVSKYPARIGSSQIDVEPTIITGNSVHAFKEDRLERPGRPLPIVVVSPRNADNRHAVDPKMLADRLAATAEVAVIPTREVSWEFARVIGRPFACFNGAVRVFWPEFDPDTDDPYYHHLFLEYLIRDPGRFSNRLFDELSSYASRLVGEGPIWVEASEIIRRGRMSELMKRLESAERDRTAAAKEQTEFEDLARQFSSAVDALSIENASLREQLIHERARTKQQSVALQHAGQSPTEEPPPPDNESDGGFPDVLSAVMSADDNFRGLRFLQSAFESADKSPYQRPDDVYSALSALNELSEARKQGSLGMALEDWLIERDVLYSPHQSGTTMGKYGDQYTFSDANHGWVMEEHLIFGKTGRDPRHCLRVHFAWDDQAEQHLIGWVGRHLQNTKT